MSINHRDDSFATMLLTCALSPDREELVHPLSALEFHQLRQIVSRSNTISLGHLIGMDMSGITNQTEVDEMTAYRLCILLGRILPLSYMMEGLTEKSVQMIAYYDPQYPDHVKRALPDSAPPVIYSCGNLALLKQRAIAIIGVSGIKLSQSLRESIRNLVCTAVENGYAIITGGELGVMHEAEKAAAECGGKIICAVAGDMIKKAYSDGFAERIACGDALCLSLAHPESLFTISHAAARMRFLFSLADAVFIMNTDLKRGEADALRAQSCKWVYAFTPDAQCNTNSLLTRGAIALKSLDEFDFVSASRNWELAKGTQLNIFDFM
ncbi:MAG: hypothetical protein E7335_08955 [Clostridiales bacterium]|nr:hypothetical protein [Clostridiales bacterium]